jgi:hypothetical protein
MSKTKDLRRNPYTCFPDLRHVGSVAEKPANEQIIPKVNQSLRLAKPKHAV